MTFASAASRVPLAPPQPSSHPILRGHLLRGLLFPAGFLFFEFHGNRPRRIVGSIRERDGGESGVLRLLLPHMCVRAGIVHTVLAAAALWLCLSGGSAGEVDAHAASLFQAIFVLNPAEHGGVFGERRAKMLERLEFLSHTIPVHIVGVHHSEHATLLSELNLSATQASGRERRVAWGRLANLAGTDAPCAFGPTALRLSVKSSNHALRPN